MPVLVMPRSIEEAKAQLADIKLKKSELSLEKKNVMEQMRQRRAEYSNTVGERATAGKGAGALISKGVGKTAKKVASVRNSYAREALARDLEPLEEQRAEIEASIAKLDQQKLQIDKWVADQKAAAKATPKPAPAKMSQAAPASAAAETRNEAAAGSAATGPDERIESLKELADLKESGVLTEEEFQAEKKRILAGN
jgi:hypothetical protein